MKYLFTGFFLCILLISCGPGSSPFIPEQHLEQVWETSFDDVGIFSSPRAVDLTGNGIKDLVFGAGKRELVETEIGVVALNGETGEVLWSIPARDEIFGSAAILDITENGMPDIIIGGRSASLFAIHGQTGDIIWEFLSDTHFYAARDKGYLNFYNPMIIPDQNGDGLKDILIANGGDVTVPPGDPGRPTGKLMVLSGRSGEIIAEADVPDDNETYMSAVIAKMHPDDDDFSIIYGTGGETLGGSLFRTTLNDVLNEDLSNSIQLASSEDKGFIAPPVLADMNGNGTLDILVNAVDGRILAIDGDTNSIMWSQDIENTEAYGSLAVGHFLEKDRLDIFTTFSIGIWPALLDTKQILINSETGEIVRMDTLGIFQTATPVAADFTNNGYDEILVSVNIGRDQFSGPRSYENLLIMYDMYHDQVIPVTEPVSGANVASTPWVGDLNGNGKLDIVFIQLEEDVNIFAMNGFRMIRLKSNLETDKKVRWGAYMGSNYSGIFRK